jgi:hypothetical protein
VQLLKSPAIKSAVLGGDSEPGAAPSGREGCDLGSRAVNRKVVGDIAC